MRNRVSYKMVQSGLFIAIGLILPYFTSHIFGMPGTVLLPMHIPVLLCGLLCGGYYGAIVGVVIPVLSSMLTGMPVMFPMLPIMAVQLFTMGLLSGLLHRRMKLHVIISLLISMISGWALYGLCYAVLMFAANGGLRALSMTAAIVKGIPGMAIYLVLIPLLVAAVEKFMKSQYQPDSRTDEMLEKARTLIKNKEATCIVMKNDEIIHKASGRGVSPLLKLYNGNPEELKNAFVADKIIGKAAAMILMLGGATRVYGEVMSVAGRDFLEKNGIENSCGRCVDMITARDKTGICPIERSVLDTDDPNEGLIRIKAAIKELMAEVG